MLNDTLKKRIASEDRSGLVGDRIPRNDDPNHIDISSSQGRCLQIRIYKKGARDKRIKTHQVLNLL